MATLPMVVTPTTYSAATAAPSIYTPASSMKVENFAADPSVTLSRLTRAQWDDYIKRFQPVENRLMDMTTYNDPNLVAQEVNAATDSSNTAINTAITARDMNRARYGLTARNDQQQLEDRQDAITRSTATIEASNRTRQNLIDRNRMIAVGGIPSAGRTYGLGTAEA